MRRLGPWMAGVSILACALLCAAQEPASSSQPTTLPAGPAASALRLHWSSAEHPSGIFYPNEHVTLSILIENPTNAPQPLEGNFKFSRGDDPPAETAKLISITPIAPAIIDAGQSAKIDLAVTFATPGSYEIAWDNQSVPESTGTSLECIYAPRATDGPPADSPWITTLPQEAFTDADFLADYCKRTGIHLFLWDCLWKPGQRDVFSPDQHALTAPQLTAMLGALKAVGGQLVIRLDAQFEVSAAASANAELSTYAGALVEQTHGLCKALALAVDHTLIAQHPDTARDIYLAVYAGVKKHDRSVMMLGFSRAADSKAVLSGMVGKVHVDEYLDALAADVDLTDATAALSSPMKKLPVWILPQWGSEAIPPAVALAANARVVPVPTEDRGVTLHLLGGSVLYQRLHPDKPPYIAVFQGNGFAVGVITGAANDPAAVSGIIGQIAYHRESMVIDTLEVADPDGSLRVVDDKGIPVDCRHGDILHLPLDLSTCYLVESGSAEDLLAALRTAVQHNAQPSK